ncbi:zinc finger protein 281-like isoform X4 [Dreissena polymorpha]|uniref:zinc finger protein 281-like isoform X4 n=1 Tax=Dreissena polymorpha TaxID=45954 RepID=UPI002263C325|nr:zinc finger protein 281-like isoform X4 [Dreissena polymorpha]
MATPDMDVIKEVPGYRIILKAVLKSQIQQLIEQLASATNEESIILTASVADGTLSHLGSDSAKGFLEDHEDVKSQFLGYCLKSHHKRKQEQEQRDREEEMRKAQEAAAASLALQQQQAQSIQSMGNMPGSMGYMPPRGPMPRFQATARSPRQQFRSPGGGLRHQPYPVTRPIQAAASPVRSPMKSPAKLDGQTIKLEPDDETSNQSATSQPSSPSSHQNMKSEPGADDANSESSSSHNEQNQEGLCLGADLSNSVSGDNIEHDPDVSVKLEAISDAEMDLEITGVEPGRPMQPQDWGANASGMNFDPTGATGSQADMTGQQGYNWHVCDHCQKAFKCVSELACHVLIHQEEKPFECSICHTRFTHRSSLKKHSLVHMDTKCKQDTRLQQRRETTPKERGGLYASIS